MIFCHLHKISDRLTLGLGSKWYTEIELTIYGMGAAFAPQTEKYSVSGNTMTFGEGKDKFSLTKK